MQRAAGDNEAAEVQRATATTRVAESRQALPAPDLPHLWVFPKAISHATATTRVLGSEWGLLTTLLPAGSQ